MTRLSILTRPVVALLVIAVSGPLLIVPNTPARASDTSTRWDSISESPGCGDPYTRTPFATKKGALTDAEAILGPFGTYFGRSFSEIREHLRFWTVPNSGGTRVRVHEAMLPALLDVTTGLAEHAAQGRVYPISSAGALSLIHI